MMRSEPRYQSSVALADPPWVRLALIAAAALFLGVFVAIPLVCVFGEALADGWGGYVAAISSPAAIAAIQLTLLAAATAVPLNVVFGLSAAWLIAKFRFRGRSALITLIDLPLGISPVISGLMFVLLFGRHGYLGPWLADSDIQVVFAVPGILLATTFVTFPFVAREVLPALEAQGSDDEEAALTLGATGFQMFRRVTLPKIKWPLIFGIILCNARAMGEFGAVSVVSGHIRGRTITVPLEAEVLYNQNDSVAAFAVASLLTLLALATLITKKIVDRKHSS